MNKSEVRRKAEAILAFAYRGIYHVPGEIYEKSGMVWVNVNDMLATFDHDTLTRLVIGAHHYCVRMEIRASGPRRLKLCFFNRASREGDLFTRHPTIEQALADLMPALSIGTGQGAHDDQDY